MNSKKCRETIVQEAGGRGHLLCRARLCCRLAIILLPSLGRHPTRHQDQNKTILSEWNSSLNK